MVNMSVTMIMHATTDELFEVMFSMRSVLRLYDENEQDKLHSWELAVTSPESLVALLDVTTKQ